MVLANPNHFCHPSLAQRFQDPRLLPLLARWHFDSAAVGRNLDCWLYRLLYRNESSWVVLFRAYDELPQAQRHSISVTHKPHGIYLLQSIGSLFLSNSNTTCPVLTPNFFCMWIAYTAGHLLAAVHWLPVPPQQRHHLSCTYTKRVVYVNSITCRAFTCCSPSGPCSSATATPLVLYLHQTCFVRGKHNLQGIYLLQSIGSLFLHNSNITNFACLFDTNCMQGINLVQSIGSLFLRNSNTTNFACVCNTNCMQGINLMQSIGSLCLRNSDLTVLYLHHTFCVCE